MTSASRGPSAIAERVVCLSGDVLPLADAGDGAVPASRRAAQHDERRLRVVHVLAAEVDPQRHAVDYRRRSAEAATQSPTFLRRQTGARRTGIRLNSTPAVSS